MILALQFIIYIIVYVMYWFAYSYRKHIKLRLFSDFNHVSLAARHLQLTLSVIPIPCTRIQLGQVDTRAGVATSMVARCRGKKTHEDQLVHQPPVGL